MNYVAKALEIAKTAHAGQYDKAGKPYIEHPICVAEHVHGNEAKATAYLHDVIEDTEVNAEDLRKEGIPEIVIEAVLAMTHREGEDYMDYIERLKQNPIAKEVKKADLAHNMDESRLPEKTKKDEERLDKYRRALEKLNN